MALDGIVLSSIVSELSTAVIGGRIDKIYQPEKDALLISVRNSRLASKMLLTANSSYPRIHLSDLVKNSPGEPPMFCMLLRKHILGGRITSINQPHFERIVEITIEATNELGDREFKKLIIEIMGRHSNIILTKEDNTIIDSIKHVSSDKSSLREVLPGRSYVYPTNQCKANPLLTTKEAFDSLLLPLAVPTFKALYTCYSGLSPMVANEICHRSQIDPDKTFDTLSKSEQDLVFKHFTTIMDSVKNDSFSPVLYLDAQHLPLEFYCLPLKLYDDHEKISFESMSKLIEHYYHEKSTRFVVSQKTSDIKKLVHNFFERTSRKKIIQEKAIEESHDKEICKMYGELLTAYSYAVPAGAKSYTTTNYYIEPYEEITIPLDETRSAIQNAQHYFKLYNKAKRTIAAAAEQLIHIEEDLNYLNSVLIALDLLETEEDINGLRDELAEMGYLKKRKISKKKVPKNPMPYMQFKSASGALIYVGKNNYQNDNLTMKFARAQDLWLHIKDGPGSHVIVRVDDPTELDDTTLIDAAILAAYYSKGKFSSNVAIDYTQRRNVKKIPNAKPGMVIYNNFKTIYVTPDEAYVKSLAL
ncbi:MAG: NFACT family protein [Cellulosilyticaceae bacterium]